MGHRGHMRHGSLQFYPRVRAKKRIPRVSWTNLSSLKEKGLLGFSYYFDDGLIQISKIVILGFLILNKNI